MRLTLLSLALLVGCGAEPAATLSPVVRIDGLLRDETATLSLFALAGRDKGGVVVTCTSLLNLQSAPAGGAYEVLADASLTFGSGALSATLEAVRAEDGVIVFVEALSSGGARIGGGCEVANVQGGKTTHVELTVFDLR